MPFITHSASFDTLQLDLAILRFICLCILFILDLAGPILHFFHTGFPYSIRVKVPPVYIFSIFSFPNP